MKNCWKIAVVIVVLLAVVGIAQLKISNAGTAPAVPAPTESVASLPAPPAPVPEAALAPAAETEKSPVLGPELPPPAAETTVESGAICPTNPDPAAPAECAATPPAPAAKPATADKPPASSPTTQSAQALPRMLDLGSLTCIPCKMMVPVMDALKQEYAGKLTVEFINVNENPAAAEKYRIQSIPTQILFDRWGKEAFRHLGYWPKEEIVAKSKELGLLS